MIGERRRALTRVGSNYVRLGINISLGLVLVPLLLDLIGKDLFGLWVLLGSTVGLGELFREVVQRSLNKELGSAYHDPDPDVFPHTLASAFGVSGLASIMAALTFGILVLLLPFFSIPAELMPTARLALIALAACSCFAVFVAPFTNMLVASERMALYNLMKILDRAALIGGAALAAWISTTEEASLFLRFVVASQVIVAINIATFSVLVMAIDSRVRFSPSRFRWSDFRVILSESSWNSLAVVAMNLHIRADQFIMNVFFGLSGNAIFGIAVQLTGYIRMIATGATDGLESVTARFAATKSSAIATLHEHSTRLHGWVVLPAVVLFILYSEPLLNLWVGSRLDDNGDSIERAAVLSKLLIVGFASRAISDGWVRLLYGAGHVRKYAPIILLGGLLNPVTAILLVTTLPGSMGFLGPAAAFSAIMFLVHFLWLPKYMASCLGIAYVDVFRPLLRPALTAIVAGPFAALGEPIHDQDSLRILAGASAYGIAYIGLSWFVVFQSAERALIRRVASRGLGRVSGPKFRGPDRSDPQGLP